jgi:hypothetical protein
VIVANELLPVLGTLASPPVEKQHGDLPELLGGKEDYSFLEENRTGFLES